MLSCFQRINGGLDNMIWCFEIRLPDAKIDDVLAFSCQLVGAREYGKGIFITKIEEIVDGVEHWVSL